MLEETVEHYVALCVHIFFFLIPLGIADAFPRKPISKFTTDINHW